MNDDQNPNPQGEDQVTPVAPAEETQKEKKPEDAKPEETPATDAQTS